MSTGISRKRAGQRVLAADERAGPPPSGAGGRHDLGSLAADHVDALGQDPLEELLVALAERPEVDVELVDLGARLLLHQVGELQGVHAADAAAVGVVVLVAAADAVEDRDRPRLAAVLEQRSSRRSSRRRCSSARTPSR